MSITLETIPDMLLHNHLVFLSNDYDNFWALSPTALKENVAEVDKHLARFQQIRHFLMSKPQTKENKKLLKDVKKFEKFDQKYKQRIQNRLEMLSYVSSKEKTERAFLTLSQDKDNNSD